MPPNAASDLVPHCLPLNDALMVMLNALKAPYSSNIDILLFKKGLLN